MASRQGQRAEKVQDSQPKKTAVEDRWQVSAGESPYQKEAPLK